MRYFIHLAYNGCLYNGWQRQSNGLGVQERIEHALCSILKCKTTCYGCGRTDTKVNAIQYFAHFDSKNSIDYDIIMMLQKALPDDITVFSIHLMEDNAHSRFDAISRQYTYFAHNSNDAFLNKVSSLMDFKDLSFVNIKKALDLLNENRDFRCLCFTPDRHNTTIVTIDYVHVYINDKGNRIKIVFQANRFLKGMVRIITDKLIEVGSGKLDVETFKEYVTCIKKPKFMNPAPPQGLYLSKVLYPYLNFPVQNGFWNLIQNENWIKI